MARPFRHPLTQSIKIDDVLHALSDPERRNVVAKLMDCNGMSCSKACEDLPASTISHHHKILRDAGLIRSEKRGVEVINQLRRQDIEKRFPGLLLAVFRADPAKSAKSSKLAATKKPMLHKTRHTA